MLVNSCLVTKILDMSTTEEIILHYQRDIEKITSHPERVQKYQDRVINTLLADFSFTTISYLTTSLSLVF